MKRAVFLVLALMLLISLCGCAEKSTSRPKDSVLWVATVLGLDYNGENKTLAEMKNALDEIVETACCCQMDAVYFQVRGRGDAMYASDLYPWSQWAGDAEKYSFDPLAYLCRQAEKKNVAIYAWVNPYRLTMYESDAPAPAIPQEWIVKAGDGRCYLNPGLTQCQDYVLAGVKEILQNYPVAGIVYDDYFYPASVAFYDDKTYNDSAVDMTKEDWRRHNTENLVRRTHELTAEYGKEFAVSPFGIWQNESSDARGSKTGGSESYSAMYADTLSWVENEYVDIIVPQIYWRCGYAVADFEVLAHWWNDAVKGTDVKLYLSLAVYHLDFWPLSEMATQMSLAAGLSRVDGCAFYRYQNIAENLGGIRDYLQK